jgi:hypothetical protein
MTMLLDKLQARKQGDADKFKTEIEEARKLKSYVLRYLIPEQENMEMLQAGEEVEKAGEEEEEEFEEVEEKKQA